MTSTLDDGSAGTLRWAITQANGSPGADSITIDPITITLTSALPVISDDVSITGDATDTTIVTCTPGNNFRVFDIGVGPTVTISQLTAEKGHLTGTINTCGAGIQSGGTLALDHVVVTECYEKPSIGGFISYDAFGGGIYSAGTLTIRDSSITNCTATGGIGSPPGMARGGGIFTTGGSTLLVERSTISNNQANGATSPLGGGFGFSYGGGLYVDSDVPDSAIIRLSTISGNHMFTSSGAFGVGIYARAGLTLDSCTVALNTDLGGAGVFIAGGIPSTGPNAKNTIVADRMDLEGKLNSRGWLLITSLNNPPNLDTTSAGNSAVGNQIGVDAQLEALADNGGPTQTHDLGQYSPAKNAGTDRSIDDALLTTDQRGYQRYYGGADIGAVESRPAFSEVTDFTLYD